MVAVGKSRLAGLVQLGVAAIGLLLSTACSSSVPAAGLSAVSESISATVAAPSSPASSLAAAPSSTSTSSPSAAAADNPTGPANLPDRLCDAFPATLASTFFRAVVPEAQDYVGSCFYDFADQPDGNNGNVTLQKFAAQSPAAYVDSFLGSGAARSLSGLGLEAAGATATEDGAVTSYVFWSRTEVMLGLIYTATDERSDRVTELAEFAQRLNANLR